MKNLLLPAIIFLAGVRALACTVPVFRYALERWEPDPHLVRVLGVRPDGDFTGMSMSDANLFLVHDGESAESGTRLVVSFEDDTVWWEGPYTPGILDKLSDSPVRRDIARRLLSGASTVFVYVGGEDDTADAARVEWLRGQLETLQSSIQLPEQEEILYDEWDPRGRFVTSIPLKVEFGLLHLRRDDAEEHMLIRQLTSVLLPGAEREEGGPVLAAIFGQGRAIVLPVSMMQEEILTDLTFFLTGPCSCQVKSLNPGHDLLMTAAWAEAVARWPDEADHVLPSGASFQFGEEHVGNPIPGTEPDVKDEARAGILHLVLGGGGIAATLGLAWLFLSRRGKRKD